MQFEMHSQRYSIIVESFGMAAQHLDMHVHDVVVVASGIQTNMHVD